MLSLRLLAGAVVAGATMLALAAPAQACTATVKGLSSNYNYDKGTGFLALRAGPSTKGGKQTIIGEAFNGQKYPVLGTKGRWVKLSALDGEVWAHGKYLRRSPRGCRG